MDDFNATLSEGVSLDEIQEAFGRAAAAGWSAAAKGGQQAVDLTADHLPSASSTLEVAPEAGDDDDDDDDDATRGQNGVDEEGIKHERPDFLICLSCYTSLNSNDFLPDLPLFLTLEGARDDDDQSEDALFQTCEACQMRLAAEAEAEARARADKAKPAAEDEQLAAPPKRDRTIRRMFAKLSRQEAYELARSKRICTRCLGVQLEPGCTFKTCAACRERDRDSYQRIKAGKRARANRMGGVSEGDAPVLYYGDQGDSGQARGVSKEGACTTVPFYGDQGDDGQAAGVREDEAAVSFYDHQGGLGQAEGVRQEDPPVLFYSHQGGFNQTRGG